MPDTNNEALPMIKNAGNLYLKILAMQPDDILDVQKSELPPSYKGMKSFVNRITKKYGFYYGVLKLSSGNGWRIFRLKNLEELETRFTFDVKSNTMKNDMPIRSYNFSDAHLAQLVDVKIVFAKRDTAQMTPRGVTDTLLDAIQAANDDFKDMPDDVELAAVVSEEVEKKNERRSMLENKLGNLRTMAQNVFGDNSARYRAFGFEGMVSETDDNLCRLAKRALRQGTAAQADLISEGCSPAFLIELKELIKEFDNRIDDVKTAEANRNLGTELRIEKGNALYSSIDKVCNTGKDIYRESDPAKYNDYVIYNTPSGADEPVPPVV